MAGAFFIDSAGGAKNMRKPFIKRENGQAMVEFAIILPLLILLLCGIVEFGWIFMNQSLLDNANRETTRFMTMSYDGSASVSTNNAVALAKMKEVLGSSVLSGSSLTLTYTIDTTTNSITVYTTYPLKTLTPVMPFATNGIITIDSQTTMRIE
jgi:Flp pilus assembly protein TadG